MGRIKLILVFALLALGLLSLLYLKTKDGTSVSQIIQKSVQENFNPLSIEYMRNNDYPGSDLVIEERLSDGNNYSQHIASYKSDGYKIYGLLTIPDGQKPKNGWPAIVFNHGYIPADQYVTTQGYGAYVDSFARNGYIVFKPDFRGHGNSEGPPEGAYYSPAYAKDSLNALASLKKYKDADPEKLGMWGHSMGGNITLRSIVVNRTDIKAGVIWAGVVGSYYDLMNNWRRSTPFTPTQREMTARGRLRQVLIDKYGSPEKNSDFWNSIDPVYFLSDINTPVQLHSGLSDATVPHEFSESLYERLLDAKKTVELYTYAGDNHNISNNFNLAMERSLAFFDKYLK